MRRDHTLPKEIVDRFGGIDAVCAAGIATRSRGTLIETQRRPHGANIEIRDSGSGQIQLAGYAAVFDTPYLVGGEPPAGFIETIAPGAFTKTLRERADVRLLINHGGVPIARTAAGTLHIEQDDIGLLVHTDNLDPSNPTVAEITSAVRRGDIDGMSIAFVAVRQAWDDHFERRTISEAELVDVSVVTWPANPTTTVAIVNNTSGNLDPSDGSDSSAPLALRRRQLDLDAIRVHARTATTRTAPGRHPTTRAADRAAARAGATNQH